MSLIPDGCLVFDVGANVGQSAQRFAAAGAGKIISVEPCPENWLALAIRPKVVPILAAVWKEPGLLTVRYALNQPGWSSVQPLKWSKAYPEADWAPEQWVPAITLDQMRAAFGDPAVVKVDTEGSEWEVLQGMHYRPPVLFFEFHGVFLDDAKTCLEYCRNLGYTRAHYTRDDCDFQTVPTTLIEEFIPRFLADSPQWGNFTMV